MTTELYTIDEAGRHHLATGMQILNSAEEVVRSLRVQGGAFGSALVSLRSVIDRLNEEQAAQRRRA